MYAYRLVGPTGSLRGRGPRNLVTLRATTFFCGSVASGRDAGPARAWFLTDAGISVGYKRSVACEAAQVIFRARRPRVKGVGARLREKRTVDLWRMYPMRLRIGTRTCTWNTHERLQLVFRRVIAKRVDEEGEAGFASKKPGHLV